MTQHSGNTALISEKILDSRFQFYSLSFIFPSYLLSSKVCLWMSENNLYAIQNCKPAIKFEHGTKYVARNVNDLFFWDNCILLKFLTLRHPSLCIHFICFMNSDSGKEELFPILNLIAIIFATSQRKVLSTQSLKKSKHQKC